MPVYSYKGVSDAGKAIRGLVDAESDRSARAKLRRDGVFLTELSVTTGARVRRDDTSQRRFSLEMLRPVGGTDLAIATRQQLLAQLGGVQFAYHSAGEMIGKDDDRGGINLGEQWLVFVLLIGLLAGEQLLAYWASYHPSLKGGTRP